jgi:hypothetical protein
MVTSQYSVYFKHSEENHFNKMHSFFNRGCHLVRFITIYAYGIILADQFGYFIFFFGSGLWNL